MRNVVLIILPILLLAGCNNSTEKSISHNNNRAFVPEPGKEERLRYEALQKSISPGCLFLNPDTSVTGLKLRDVQSGKSFISENEKADTLEQYHYYSKTFREMLSLTQHPGDAKFQISIMEVEYAKKKDHGYRQLSADTFKTEKGIKLGMAKTEIINRLGSCYEALDSTKDYIELYYKIEAPQDSKTKLLANHNMPVYNASYRFRNDRLERFEFGFEYP